MKRLVLLACLLLTLPSWGAVAFVNSVQTAGGTTGTNGSGSMTLTAGNTVLVFVAFYNGQLNGPHVCTTSDAAAPCNSANGVTDSQGSTYSKLAVIGPSDTTCSGGTGSTSCPFVELWATTNVASSCTGAGCTIQVVNTPTGTGTGPAILFQQYSGVAAINLTNQVTGSGSSATSATLSISMSYANDFVVGAFADNPVNVLSVNGCTARGSNTNNAGGTVNIKSCDNTSATPGASVSVGMTFSSAKWAGAAVELCTTSPCPAGGVKNNVVIIN